MTKMTYRKTVTKQVKPTVVNLNLSIKATSTYPDVAIMILNDSTKLCKDFITSKKSYRPDSNKSKNIDFRKVMKKEVNYRHIQDPSRIISVEMFNKLGVREASLYEKVSKEVFDRYEANIMISATLDNSKTVVDDFTDIINMCVEKEIYCTYDHNITDEERQHYGLQMYAECINEATKEIKEIISNTAIASDNFNIVEIADNYNSNVIGKSCTLDYASDYTPEQYFIPELVRELFNNNIRLVQSLQLIVEF